MRSFFSFWLKLSQLPIEDFSASDEMLSQLLIEDFSTSEEKFSQLLMRSTLSF